MKKINVLFIVGTRPEVIKIAPIIIGAKRQESINPILCCTGQHREMLIHSLRTFGLESDYNLDVMKDHQDLSGLTARLIEGLSSLLKKVSADVIVVQGDTTTAFAGALAAFYKALPVWHIEAGLRTNNIYSPWPEEVNRQLISRIARHHFAPTERAKRNLLNEGVCEANITVTGNTVIDSLLWVAKNNVVTPKFWDSNFVSSIKNRKLILVTTHRRENQDGTINNLCCAINRLAQRDDVFVIFPVHPNPNVRQTVLDQISSAPNIKIIDPLEYCEFVHLLKHCHFIITDSGGLQEEAPSLGKPVLVVRDTTERQEAIEAGTARLVGKAEEGIYQASLTLLNNFDEYDVMSMAKNPYGDGTASEKIIQEILNLNHREWPPEDFV